LPKGVIYMPTLEQVNEALGWVLVPGVGRSLVKLGMVRNVEVASDEVNITLASTGLYPQAKDWVENKVRAEVEKLPEVNKLTISFVEPPPKELNEIHSTIAVMSGKGGVGKSLVTGLLAIALNHKGCDVGILDADITGPSIPKMFGITQRPEGSEAGILPVLSRSGIEIMSINLMLPHEDDAVIWRGPLIGKAIQQFWGDVIWGKLDSILVDLPPGTADASLTVAQSLPLSGVIIVTSPQELAAMVVRKAINMARQVNIPILGVVENMSYFPSPETGKKIEIFGKSKGEEMAKTAGVPFLGQIPLDSEIARLCDEGWIERYNSQAFDSLAQTSAKAISGLIHKN
jgi:hydrogenase maturation protease